MKKLILSSVLAGLVLFSGCGGNSSCCKADLGTKAQAIPPVAAITGIDNPTVIALGQSIEANGIASSDRDGNVASYEWMVDGKKVSSTKSSTFTFNDTGDHELCLKVYDNENNPSVNVECRTIKVLGKNTNTPVTPTAVITLTDENDLSPWSLHKFLCNESHDNDTLGTNPEIVSCQWDIQSYTINSNGNEIPYRSCTADVMSGKKVHICPQASKIVAKLTVTDNDGQRNSTTKVYNLK